MSVYFQWCNGVRAMLDATSRESVVPVKYAKAFRFLKGLWVKTPNDIHYERPPVVRLKPYAGFVTIINNEEVRLDGLTGELNSVFHPVQLGIPTGGAATGGAARGMIVDKEIERMVNGEDLSELHVYTVRTIQLLIKNKLRPFACQFAVGSIELNLATTLDMVCVNTADPEGGLVNIQLKTGFERNYTKTSGMLFQAPHHADPKLESIEDTHHNRHMLQLCAEHLIVQTVYNNPLDFSMLMVISGDHHQLFCMGQNWENTIAHGIPPDSVYLNLRKRKDCDPVHAELDAVRKKHAIKKIMRKKRRNIRHHKRK